MKKEVIKAIASLSAAVILAGALVGCGSTKSSTSTSTQTKKDLVMGTNAAFPPFEFVTTEGKGTVDKYDGIDINIAKTIADDAGMTLKIEDMEFDSLIAALGSGKVDMVIAGMTANDERRQSVDFSDTYYVAKQVMLVAKDNTTITKADDLKNVKQGVGVVAGYTGDTAVTDTVKVPDDKILRVSRGIDAVQDVKNGKLDAVVIDSATGEALAKENNLKVVEDQTVFESEEYAIAVKKGNKDLLTKINKTLASMKSSGKIDELSKKYNSETSASTAATAK